MLISKNRYLFRLVFKSFHYGLKDSQNTTPFLIHFGDYEAILRKNRYSSKQPDETCSVDPLKSKQKSGSTSVSQNINAAEEKKEEDLIGIFKDLYNKSKKQSEMIDSKSLKPNDPSSNKSEKEKKNPYTPSEKDHNALKAIINKIALSSEISTIDIHLFLDLLRGLRTKQSKFLEENTIYSLVKKVKLEKIALDDLKRLTVFDIADLIEFDRSLLKDGNEYKSTIFQSIIVSLIERKISFFSVYELRKLLEKLLQMASSENRNSKSNFSHVCKLIEKRIFQLSEKPVNRLDLPFYFLLAKVKFKY
jgi:hypothetical protein